MTHYNNIEGMVTDAKGTRFKNVAVRFTSDMIGETLSLADENFGIMITVPFEAVERIIEKARNAK